MNKQAGLRLCCSYGTKSGFLARLGLKISEKQVNMTKYRQKHGTKKKIHKDTYHLRVSMIRKYHNHMHRLSYGTMRNGHLNTNKQRPAHESKIIIKVKQSAR